MPENYVKLTTLGEIDPEFCALFKAALAKDFDMAWARVYTKANYGALAVEGPYQEVQ